MGRAFVVATVLAASLVATASAAAPAPPLHGVVVEGRSFGGLPLGLTPDQVRARWGRQYGVCQGCRAPTWFYTYEKFKPLGIGVQFHRGRVESYYTVGAPPWRSLRGLRVKDDIDRVTKLYGDVPTVECIGYSVREVVRGGKLFLIYLEGIQVYGLGLAERNSSPCR